jgi:hypothetical protein
MVDSHGPPNFRRSYVGDNTSESDMESRMCANCEASRERVVLTRFVWRLAFRKLNIYTNLFYCVLSVLNR